MMRQRPELWYSVMGLDRPAGVAAGAHGNSRLPPESLRLAAAAVRPPSQALSPAEEAHNLNVVVPRAIRYQWRDTSI